MAKLTRKNIKKQHFQSFRGGLRHLSPMLKAQLRGTCCEGDLELQKDRLPTRMRFDNGLAHENPKGANQKWILSLAPDRREVIAHLNDYKKSATVGVLALPSYSFITALAISVGALATGFTFKLASRNGTLEAVTGTLHLVTTSGGNDCDPIREYTATENQGLDATVVTGLAAGEMRKDYIFIPDKPIFQAQADEVQMVIETFATDDVVTEKNMDITIAANYDVVIRSEF